MKQKYFDFEVFPNWWCCVFGDLPSDWETNRPTEQIKDNFRVVTSDDVNARDKLLQEMTEENSVNVGYNIKGYDLMIANGIYQGFTPEQIKMINDIIINPSMAWASKEQSRMAPFAKRRMSGITYLDLYDSSDGTLKDKEATFGLSILESSVPFDKADLTAKDKDDIIYYCKHDVWSAMYWFMKIVSPFLKSKLAVVKTFNLNIRDGYNCTNAQLVAKAVDAHRQEFADADRTDIVLPEKVNKYIRDNLPENVVNYVISNTNTKTFDIFKNKVVFADGGIHSIYYTNPVKAGEDILYVESDSEYGLWNVDASSYYPSIMIRLGTLSRSIKNKERFEFVYDDRIRIKHKKDKTPDDDLLQLAYKLILNTTYGASGCEYLDLCDKYQRTRTCRYGQLLLTALANKLANNISNLSVIQTNTDGILIYAPRKYLDKVTQLKDEWVDMTGIGMDIDEVSKIWQRDVNNYLMEKTNGKIKRKGAWLTDDYIKPGYIKIAPLDVYGVGKAAIKWLTKGINPLQTMLRNNDITDFCVFCKKGPTYSGVVQKFADGHEEELYKSNRVIAIKDESYGSIYKYKVDGDGVRHYGQMPNAPEHCLLVNDGLSTYNFNELKKHLDWNYYLTRLYDKLNYTYKQLVENSLHIINSFDIS